MTLVTSRSNPLFQSVRLRFASTHNIRFSSGSLFAILKNTVWVQLRFDKNSVKPVYKTLVLVCFDSLVFGYQYQTNAIGLQFSTLNVMLDCFVI